jgi:hypothetical protein
MAAPERDDIALNCQSLVPVYLISPFAIANGRLGRGKFLAAAFRTWSSHFGGSWTRKMLRMAAHNALPYQRFLLGSLLYSLEHRIGLVAN